MFQPYFMKKKCIPLDIGTNVDPTVFLSDYSTISNANFKDILLATVMTNDFPRNSFTELLNNNEQILTYTRQLTILMNKLNYYKLQQEQWTYYYQLGITEGIWNGRVSKAMAQMNSMCHTYGRSKVIVNQRREKYQKQLEQTENELHEYMKQAPTHVDINQLTTIVTHFIHQDQYSLRIEMERRRQMLKWNAEDHRLIEIFYKLEPRQTEIHSATVIWKATSAEQTLRSEIEIFKTWVSSRSSLTFYTYRDLGLTTINEILTQLVFDQQCVITNLNKSINELDLNQNFIDHITIQVPAKAEQTAQVYTKKVIDEKVKLFSMKKKTDGKTTIDSFLSAIENRTNNIIQRAHYNTKHKLQMICNEIGTHKL
ncbi:unnamed protein product [Rotaria sp. Silwood2]|nr:unnamed protein product [Rotaria sp. Silwood2]